MSKTLSLATLSLLALAVNSSPCMWDTDTLAAESKGKMDFVAVLVGRFERNPPLYYQMRIDREMPEVTKNPALLDHYDDIGVAEARLGKNDLALSWMARKRAELKKLGSKDSDQWYRLYANEGTFFAHRWFAGGADRKHPSDLKQAISEIDQAIKINPNAHFGREWVQRDFLKWALKPGEGNFSDYLGYDSIDGFNEIDNGKLSDSQRDTAMDAAQKGALRNALGLAGLIRLGGAWESPDITAALGRMLPQIRSGQVAGLAFLRTKELIGQGKKPLAEDLGLDNPFTYYGENGPSQAAWPFNVSQFRSLRAAADEWHQRRTDFMIDRLREGRHPDTDPHFWDGYKDGPQLVVREPYPWEKPYFWPQFALGSVCCVLPSALFIWFCVRLWKSRYARP
jgi:hypothetical protein